MNKLRKGVLLLAILSAHCNQRPGNQTGIDTLQTIIIDKQADWGGNFKLHILNKSIKDTSYVYKGCSVDNGQPAGFELEIPIRINKFGDGVVFRTLGDTSDNFLKKLYSIYGLRLQNNLKFTTKILCSYAGLNDLSFKGNGEKRPETINHIKIFFEGAGEDEYAELYLNIDEINKMVEFEEKGFEYRPYVALFLTAK